MAQSGIRERTNAAKGKPPPAEDKEPLQITLLGHDLVLNPFDLYFSERTKWKRYLAEGEATDEVDFMFALAVVMIQRVDPTFTWERAQAEITWQMMLDAVAAGRPSEADHPQS